MRSLLAFVLLVGCVGSGGDEGDQRARCNELRKHVVDIRLQSVPVEDREAHRGAALDALDDDFASQCLQMSSERVSCGLRARDHTALLACGKQ